MKKIYSGLLAVCMLFAFACKKSNNTGTTDPIIKPKKYLTHIIASSSIPGPNGTSTTSTINTYYTYDSQKRLSTIKNGDNIITYAYYDNGDLYTVTNESSFVNSSTIEFAYADGKLKQYTLRKFKSGIVDSETPYVYVYEGNRVTEIHWEVYYLKFTYDSSGNIARIFNYGDPQYYLVYTYDNKKSIFTNALAKYPTVGNISGAFSPNNVATSTTEGLNQNVLSTYTYNYDDEGYPTGSVMTASIVNAVTSKYTYEYSTLQ